MPDLPKIPAPKALKKRGRKFWRDVTSRWILRADELVVLENACRLVDLVDELEADLAGQSLTVTGSMGQQRENPLLSEMRQQRALLNRTLAQLKLPDDSGAVAPVNQHRAAGMSRWAAAHGRYGT